MSCLRTIPVEEFEAKVLNSAIPVVVLFAPPDCVACKALEAAILKVRLRFLSEVEFVRVDVSEVSGVPGLAERHGVVTLPTLGLFYDGALRDAWRMPGRGEPLPESLATLDGHPTGFR